MKKVVFLREVFNWMGNHSGYDQVCNHIALSEEFHCYNVFKPGDESQLSSITKNYLYIRKSYAFH